LIAYSRRVCTSSMPDLAPESSPNSPLGLGGVGPNAVLGLATRETQERARYSTGSGLPRPFSGNLPLFAGKNGHRGPQILEPDRLTSIWSREKVDALATRGATRGQTCDGPGPRLKRGPRPGLQGTCA